jgi:hypothetical protein
MDHSKLQTISVAFFVGDGGWGEVLVSSFFVDYHDLLFLKLLHKVKKEKNIKARHHHHQLSTQKSC